MAWLGWVTGSRAGRLVALAVLAALAFGAWTAWQRTDAVNDALRKIEEINHEIENNAIDARDALRRCTDAGGLWDFASGRCT